MLRHLSILCFAIVVLFMSAPAIAKDRMTFRNNLLPGHLSVHRVLRTIKRIAPRPDYDETIEYAVVGEWVQCNLDEPKPGTATVYQMFSDERPRMIAVYRGSESVKPVPDPSTFNIEPGATYLNTERRTNRDSPFQPPSGEPAHAAMLEAIMDVGHWHAKTIDVGHTWERDIVLSNFSGKQRFQFADIETTDIGKVGKLRMIVEGRFTNGLERTHRFETARAEIYWANMQKSLAALEAKAEYVRLRPTGDEKYELRVDVGLKDVQVLTEPQTELMRQQLTVFAEGLKRINRKDYSGAREACRQYRAAWPSSVWLPAVNELEFQAANVATPRKPLRTSELINAITQSLVQWEAALENQQYDMLDQTREGLTELVAAERAKILQLTREKKNTTRAAAAFALAFSVDPGDFQTVQKLTRDSSARVRGLALTGIAARRDTNTSAEMLLLRLGDEHFKVRARACRAVAACIPREHLSIAPIAERLIELMQNDAKASVRREAIRALGAVGAPADISRLEAALETERDLANQTAIRRAIERLRKLG